MANPLSVVCLPRSEINPQAWDAALGRCFNTLPYAQAWYLDIVAPRWEAMIWGDYEAILPLPVHRKRLLFKEVYSPLLCQQLGIFTPHPLAPQQTLALLRAIPRRYRRLNMPLNAANTLPTETAPFKVSQRPNLVLPLQPTYEAIRQNYSENHRRNLKKAERSGLYLSDTCSPEQLLDMVRRYQAEKGNRIPELLYQNATQIMDIALRQEAGEICCTCSPNGEIAAAIFFLKGHGRWINLLNVNNPDSSLSGGMHFLIDRIIRREAQTAALLDFEGSAIPGIARFYEGFGAEHQPYLKVSRNTLPRVLRVGLLR